MSKRKREEGAPADERWENDGGAAAGDGAEKATAEEDRAKRWKDANAEHWHGSGPSDATKRRTTEH